MTVERRLLTDAAMEMLLRIALTCIFTFEIVVVASAAPDDFYRAHLPEGVSMGMSPEELAKARPTARSFDLSGMDRRPAAKPAGAPAEMVEMTRELGRASVRSYRFKAGKLVAVLESTKTLNQPIEQAKAAVGKLTEEIKTHFTLKGQEQIVRSKGTVAGLLTAQVWEDQARGLQLYLVATDDEISVWLFDPKMAGKADFFNGPEMLEKTKANNESIRRQLGDRANPVTPLVDLLAEPKVEKK